MLATNDERFPMIVDDLRVMPDRPDILVEGPRLFPKLVAPLLSSPHRAVWLVPTAEFARESITRRDKPQGRFASRDPERFRQNVLRREQLPAAYIRQEVTRRGLPLIEVGRSRSAEDVAAMVEAHFAPYPPARHRAAT